MQYRNILLIDDDDDDQEIFLAAVEEVSSDASCMAMGDARAALRKLMEKEVTPDVIFLDLNMPIMNGQQFLKEIKTRNDLQHIPVIIFSTSSQPETIDETKELGASDFITKPSTYTDLVDLLGQHLR